MGSASPAYLELGSDATPALGFIELSSIVRGLFVTDVALKKAPVRIIASQPISSGKHVLLFMGDVASVEESHAAALAAVDGTLVRQVLIPSVHPQLAPFLDSLWSTTEMKTEPVLDSVGLIESSSLAGAILSADAALKSARVALCRLRLGQGIGGKAYYVLTGRQEEVEAALESARASLTQLDSLGRTDLIARPAEEALAYF